MQEQSQASAVVYGPAVARLVTFTYDAGSHRELRNLKLRGDWEGSGPVPMKPLGDGRWQVTLPVPEAGSPRWGVLADGPTGEGQWALMGEAALLVPPGPEASHAPTTYHRMGPQRRPDGGVALRFWAPHARAVAVKLVDAQGRARRLPMRGPGDGTWVCALAPGLARLPGLTYRYQVTTSEGARVERPDPYAREMQGEQRGLSRTFLDVRTGAEVSPYFVQPDLARRLAEAHGGWDAVPAAERAAALEASRAEFLRFEIDGAPTHLRAELALLDADGRQLTRAQLLERLGGPLDPRLDPALATSSRGGHLDDLWSRRCAADGAIALVDEAGTWTTFVQRPLALVGLRYEFRCFDLGPDGRERLVGDLDGDGRLTRAEREADPANDPWDNTLEAMSGVSFRGSLLPVASPFAFRHDAAPRETEHARWIIEQVHVGSFLATGDNANRSTLRDLTAALGYFKELGVNALELLPTNEVEGTRDWGYLGASSLATEASLGFEDDDGRWVSGTEALQRFIDAAHGAGLNVVGDVVYNHVGGAENFLWELDGAHNPWFNWDREATAPAAIRETPWGAMPAYANPWVRQFFVDHAVFQVCELHHDGLRFDFTEPIKGGGGLPGWELLREINRALHFFRPRTFTAAEQFDYDPAMTVPSGPGGQGGGGFDAQWYTEFQHRLVHDTGRPGLLQQAAWGQRTDLDEFLWLLLRPRGLSAWPNGVTILSDHDEVGNGDRTINVASNGEPGLPSARARALARFAAGMAFTAPGIPMFFQGEESLAQNRFQWGVPATWDLGWTWRTAGPEATPLDLARRQHFEFFRDAIALRKAHRALDADGEVRRLYTHNDDSVLAFERLNGRSDLVVAGSLNRSDLSGYPLPLPSGQWREVFNSDAERYGGGNFGNFGATLPGGSTPVNLPAGGYVVLERVG